jgi:hypothetical protein
VLVFVGVVMGPGRVSLWGWFEEPGPILSEVFSKPMGRKKLVGWEHPIFGHALFKSDGVRKTSWSRWYRQNKSFFINDGELSLK